MPSAMRSGFSVILALLAVVQESEHLSAPGDFLTDVLPQLRSVASQIQGVLLEPIAFEDFVNIFHKSYSSPEEKHRREEIFNEHQEEIIGHNRRYTRNETTYYQGINEFSDLTDEEMSRDLVMDSPSDDAENLGYYRETDKDRENEDTCERHNDDIRDAKELLPLIRRKRQSKKSCLDWRKQEIVGSIKSQSGPGRCKSCWAFATTALVESFFSLQGKLQKKSNSKPRNLSEQQLIDCTNSKNSKYNNKGCGGGHPVRAFPYIKKVGGMNRESCIPFRNNESGKCKAKSSCTHDKRIAIGKSVFKSYVSDADLVKMLKKHGPISVTYRFTSKMTYYKGGIFKDRECEPGRVTRLNHASLLVGYCSNYYIIKNSHGKSWGEDGYLRLKRGGNHCGVGLDVLAILPK